MPSGAYETSLDTSSQAPINWEVDEPGYIYIIYRYSS